MACEIIRDKDGRTTAILCGPRQRTKRCEITGCNGAGVFLCDFPLIGIRAGATCSKRLCKAHAIKQGSVTRLETDPLVQAAHNDAKRNAGDPRFAKIARTIPAGEPDSVDYCPAHDTAARRAREESESA